MNQPIIHQRGSDPIIDEIEALITEHTGMIAHLKGLRAEVEARNAATVRDHQGMIDAARGIAKADYLRPAEVAAILGCSASAVQHGTSGTECLNRARIKNGRSVKHLRRRVELHKANRDQRGHCGDCDQANFDGLKAMK